MGYGGVILLRVRLPKKLEEKIDLLAKQEKLTKSDIVREALENYIRQKEKQARPYELGKKVFGKDGSGEGDLSARYKQEVRRKINKKLSN